jgi:hypothetical protein
MIESVIFNWLTIAAVIGYIIYWHSTSTFSYWKNRGIPYLKPTPGFGNTRKMFFKISFAEQFKKFYDEFNDEPVCGVFQFRSPVLVVRDPEIIKLVMVKDFQYFQVRNWLNKLTLRLMELRGSMPHSQRLSNNPYPEPNQPNSTY